MTDGEILKIASDVGWNTEHKASNDYLIKFARALMDKLNPPVERYQFGTPLLDVFKENT